MFWFEYESVYWVDKIVWPKWARYSLAVGDHIAVWHKFLRVNIGQEPVERFAFEAIAQRFAIGQIPDARMILSEDREIGLN